MRTIYGFLAENQVPHVNRLVFSYEDDLTHGSQLYLSPKGVERRPDSEEELKAAVWCVLNALSVRLFSLSANSVLTDLSLGDA